MIKVCIIALIKQFIPKLSLIKLLGYMSRSYNYNIIVANYAQSYIQHNYINNAIK